MNARIARRAMESAAALALVASAAFVDTAHAASATVRLVDSARLANVTAEGLAVIGSRYLYIGTSTGNTMDVLDLRAGRAVRWTLPNVEGGQGYAYGMEHLALSPDNRTLYFGNLVRGDVVALDVTGRAPLREIFLTSPDRIPVGLEVSADNRYLYVQGGSGTDVYDAATGTEVAHIPTADRAAPAPDGTLYGVSFSAGHVDVRAFGETGGNGRLLTGFNGSTLAQKDGSIALSSDGRRLYVLWNGLRVLDPRNGRLLGTVPLPLQPSYTGMAIAPNGRQAMLWAPNIAGWYETPTDNPQYIYEHFGFVAGGVLPIDLAGMRPIKAALQRITTPKDVAYTSDSRYALVTENHMLDLLATGTSGPDHAVYSPVSLATPRAPDAGNNSTTDSGTTGTGGATSTTPTATPTAVCSAWDVSGTWTFTADPTSTGPQNGTATLQQSGSSVTGALTQSWGSYALAGTVQGSVLTLTFHNPTLIDQTFTFTISADGTAMAGNPGTFSGHARC